MFFNDQRKFGFMKVLPTEAVEREKFIAELGKEPWEMTIEELFAGCQRHGRAPIKAVLLDHIILCKGASGNAGGGFDAGGGGADFGRGADDDAGGD